MSNYPSNSLCDKPTLKIHKRQNNPGLSQQYGRTILGQIENEVFAEKKNV